MLPRNSFYFCHVDLGYLASREPYGPPAWPLPPSMDSRLPPPTPTLHLIASRMAPFLWGYLVTGSDFQTFLKVVELFFPNELGSQNPTHKTAWSRKQSLDRELVISWQTELLSHRATLRHPTNPRNTTEKCLGEGCRAVTGHSPVEFLSSFLIVPSEIQF